jgi:hypothetical protein
MRIQEREGCRTGPAFGCSNGLGGLMSEYNNTLQFFLHKVQDTYPDLVSPANMVGMNHGFSQTSRRTEKG